MSPNRCLRLHLPRPWRSAWRSQLPSYATRSVLAGPLLAAVVLFAGRTAAAQLPLLTLDGNSADDLLGYSVAGAGDVNADGYDDIIVGARGDDPSGLNSAGSAYVHSGLDGSQIWEFHGDTAGDTLGYAVAGVGDVNLDGFDDLAVGATQDEIFLPDTGVVRVYSGQTGTLLFFISGSETGSLFGSAIAGCGDWNADGRPDIAIGAPNQDVTILTTTFANAGVVRIVSSVGGTTIVNLNGIDAGQNLGWSVAAAGDVDNDGFDDVVVGSPFANTGFPGAGNAQVYSGKFKSLLFTKTGTAASEFLGIGVGGAGDVNNDGFDDIIAGAYGAGGNAGSARVFLGPAGAASWVFNGTAANDRMGYAVDGAGDVDKDGWADIMAGAYQATAGAKGYARVWSGKTGAQLYTTLTGDGSDDDFGRTLAAAGDTNGDGWADIVVGAPNNDGNGGDAGRARVFDLLKHQKNVGFQGPGSALLEMYGTPLATGGLADIRLSGAAPGKLATLVASASLNPVPFKGGMLAPNIAASAFFPFTSSASGDVLLASVPGGSGPVFVYIQFSIKDPAQPLGFALSNCVQAEYLP